MKRGKLKEIYIWLPGLVIGLLVLTICNTLHVVSYKYESAIYIANISNISFHEGNTKKTQIFRVKLYRFS